jgi:[ribosomal protein S18]-alanine N-acetyltransferase
MRTHPASIRVRPMALADVDHVIEIVAALPYAPQWSRTAWAAVLDPAAIPHRIALLAENGTDGAVIACAVASLVLQEAELESIAVAPGFQRRGVARELFSRLAEALRRAGASGINLEVRASNQPALALYKALGFTHAGSRARYYQDPVEDAVLMTLPLR